jgi:thioredoxin 1
MQRSYFIHLNTKIANCRNFLLFFFVSNIGIFFKTNSFFTMANTLEITDANFNEVLNTDQVVLVDFWAEWCGPCKMIGPVVAELANEYAGKAVIGKLDVDSNSITSSQFNVRSIPTLLFFRNGEVVDKVVGAVPKATLESKLKALIG